MYGKNIIDILIGTKNEEEFNKISKILINEGYISGDKSKTEIYQFFASKKEKTVSGDIHIYLVIRNIRTIYVTNLLKNECSLLYKNNKLSVIN